MNKIHCLNAISQHGTALLTDAYQLTDNLAEADGILVRSAAMHDMELPESLLAIARAGAGVNNIPLDKCAEKGIVVFNTPGANANAVKELVIGAMMLSARDILGGIAWCRDNKDDEAIAKSTEKNKKKFAGTEIKGKKLGVIGLGAIGAEIANAAAALGMEVLGYDPYISVRAAWMLSREVRPVSSADTIYAECDYITIHVPATSTTKGMIDKAAIEKMKDGVVFLNFSRDALVDEDAMAEGLASGKVRKYVTDFPDTKVVNMENAIVIPHLGASTEEAEDNCATMAVMEMMDYMENGNIQNSVNYPACDMGVCRTAARVAVLHKNIPNMLGQITSIMAAENVNISDMTNKSRDKVAYTLLDLESVPGKEAIEKLRAVDGILRVRVVKG